MTDDYVNLETAKALAEVGYPQAPGTEQYIWTDYSSWIIKGKRQKKWGLEHRTSIDPARYFALEDWLPPQDWTWLWYAAPTHLAALDWLEKEKGYIWEKEKKLGYSAYHGGMSYLSKTGGDIYYTTPDELILAICNHISVAH